MKIGMIGLGKMGANMTERLLKGGHEVVAYDLSADALKAAASKGAETASTLAELTGKLDSPKAVWVMLPAGKVTDSTVEELAGMFSPGDVIVDGGNSNYKEWIALSEKIASSGVGLVDAGTSGGVWGLTEGYCLMVGGAKESVAVVEPALLTLAPEGGYAHVGPVGAGHFVKMVHNGIEYGLMQAYAEGFEIMGAADEFDLDLHEIASIWRYGSVVRSWLLELAERALRPGAGFDEIKGVVADSGEGRWTAQEAIDRGVSAPVIATSLFTRFASQEPDAFQLKMLSALRNQFGGHAVTLESGAAGPGDRNPDALTVSMITPVDDVPRAFADAVVQAYGARPGPRFALVLSGGPTAKECYEVLATTPADAIDWTLVDVYVGDERVVPPDDDDANQRLIKEALLDRVVGGPVGSFSPMPTVGPLDQCVDAYQRTMSDLVTGPGIDLIHLGMGPDGHTASLFPGASTLDADPGVLVLATEDPNGVNPHPRLTLTLPAINSARVAVFTVSGASKAPAVAALVRGDDLPASRVHAGRTVWLVDGAARADAP